MALWLKSRRLVGDPIASLSHWREDEGELAELEVGSDALALDEHARVDLGHKLLEVGVLCEARVHLDILARLADGATGRAHADAGDWRAGWHRDAHAIWAAWLGGAVVGGLAVDAGEADWALALVAEDGWQVGALAVVHARVGLAAERHDGLEVAADQVRVVDEVLWAVHDGELAEAVADDELVDVGRVWDDVTWLRTLAQVNLLCLHWNHLGLGEVGGADYVVGLLRELVHRWLLNESLLDWRRSSGRGGRGGNHWRVEDKAVRVKHLLLLHLRLGQLVGKWLVGKWLVGHVHHCRNRALDGHEHAVGR